MDRRGFLGLATGSIFGRGAGAEQVTPPGGGRVTRSVTQYLANNAVFNVRDFGARGDGTDDGPAIRRALDAAGAAGGTLVFPHGTYSYAESPNFARDDLEVLGQGRATLRHTGCTVAGTKIPFADLCSRAAMSMASASAEAPS